MSIIRRYTTEDRDSLFAFRQQMYGPDSIYCDLDYIRWLYGDDAHRRTAPALWVYRASGRVEGEQGAIPVPLRVGGQDVDAQWVVDLAVSTRLQNHGIGTLLNQTACAESPLSMAMEVSDRAFGVFLNAGWVDLGKVPLWTRALNAKVPLGASRRSQDAASFGATAASLLSGAAGRLFPTRRHEQLRMEPTERFDERVDALWCSAAARYPVIARRDSRTLNWRFADFPLHDRYQLFHLYSADILRAYAVLRTGRRRNLPVGYLSDFLCEPRWLRSVLAACVAFFRAAGAVAVYCLHRDPVSSSPWRLNGFVPRDSDWHFMIRPNRLRPNLHQMILDRGNWFLTAGDSNVDRPRDETISAAESLQ